MSTDSRIVKTAQKTSHTYAIHEMREGVAASRCTYAITVVGPLGGYGVFEIGYLPDAERMAEALPPPSEKTIGARLLGVTDTEHDGDTVEHRHYFLLENLDDTGALEFDKLYDLGGLISGEALETQARRPDMAIVAVDETANWNDNVVAVCGRIKGIYGINRNDDSYAQVWMEFLSNQCERQMMNLDEADIDEEFQKIGYDTQTDFEYDNSGDRGREVGRWEISKLEVLETLTPPTDWIAEYMLDDSEGGRLGRESEYYREVQANGLPGAPFDGQRTDEEIIEAGRALKTGGATP
ncbi:hypothetical protein G6L37_01465 [Agrobacterium rubi]|nr:hypothetical protein [Agrobacterium rubi]NTF24061.1 hypothetical protein [Agrobacterium rubi]